MNHFSYIDGELCCENVPLRRIAQDVGTPAYIYSHATLVRHFQAFDGSFKDLDHLTCFSVKACSNLAILNLLASMGAGVDIVSGGELHRALLAGVPADRIVFSGVGKTEEEIRDAVTAGILMFNVESHQEIDLLSRAAENLGKKARIALRINPDVDPKTHPYISTGLRKNKFGIPIEDAEEQYLRAAGLPGLEVVGIDCHLGSQITEVGPFVDGLNRLRNLLDQLKKRGLNIRYLDMGGGLGITYDTEQPPEPIDYARALKERLSGTDTTLILEPGRVIVGNAAVLLVQVLFTKKGATRNFLVTNGGMNDLVRPSLYGSYHAVWPVAKTDRPPTTVDVVGPICESSDFLAKERSLPEALPGDLLAVMSAGAYGFSMSSNYNSRRRAPEILVKGDAIHVIRRRETFEDLTRGEQIPDLG
jgi:diaminopimelate decarboxylase